MDKKQLLHLLKQVQEGSVSIDQALQNLENFPEKILEHTVIDTHRGLRTGFAEVVFAQDKTAEQLAAIIDAHPPGAPFLATRLQPEHISLIKRTYTDLYLDELARCCYRAPQAVEMLAGEVVVVSAGTSDSSVSAEAVCTLRAFGARVRTVNDVGIAGLHRLLSRLDSIRSADVVIAVAGMEGALPSAITGLCQKPVIAVPTSVGYGSHGQGMVALMAMLNSCASGMSVVNIDNGFGAAMAALRILRLSEPC